MRFATLTHFEDVAGRQLAAARCDGLKDGSVTADTPEKGCRRGLNGDNRRIDVPDGARDPRQGTDDRDGWLQSLDGTACGTLHSSLYRHGLRLQRVLAASVARNRTEGAKDLPGHVAGAGA